MMTRRNGPGELEAQVMRRLRATAGPLTGRQVWESFTGPNPPARTTVLTVLARLEAVSYTHLDVYKRQVDRTGWLPGKPPRPGAAVSLSERLLAWICEASPLPCCGLRRYDG